MIETPRCKKNMIQKSWMIWVLLVVLLWICPVSPGKNRKNVYEEIKGCLRNNRHIFIVPDNYSGVVYPTRHNFTFGHGCSYSTPGKEAQTDICVTFLKKTTATQKRKYNKRTPELKEISGSSSQCHFKSISDGSCRITRLETKAVCSKSTYNEKFCSRDSLFNSKNNDKYIINATESNQNCYNCDNPVKVPEAELEVDAGFQIEDGEDIDPVKAVEVMNCMTSLSSQMNGSSASLSVGGGVTGVLVKQTETESVDLEEVSFGYASSNTSVNIIENRDQLHGFSTSVTVSKEAFEKAYNASNGTAFVALLRFNNMAKDEFNSTVLQNMVLAIEMGVLISNLTNDIFLNFRKVKEKGIPSCRSWNGEGSRPNWTDGGCVTHVDEDNITCQCSHLTFFAVLMSPPNTTISSADLTSLTYITYIGCGLSMFFLGIILFMHFLLRRAKASKATHILIHLVLALFLLNLTFLTNNWVAGLKSAVGCKIMAAVMHYSMLATFTWFAVEAFHLCLQVYTGGKIIIHRYILKVSLASWALPSVIVIVLFSVGKYDELVIHTDENDVTMCWITDSNVHYIVNIGYYALVFLFTIATFIVILCWLFRLKKTKAGAAQVGRSGRSIVTVLGLCCMLGITWGFAFFAHGVLRVPSYYIFTILNSFQGFFLFLYYYNTRQLIGETTDGVSSKKTADSSSNTNSCTVNTTLDSFENPYNTKPTKTKPQD
ncbi:adhesion G-protein coupled receptor G1-like isoform X2 [Centroberyx affinis]|uniref:adhesion G-protein coupled receptor G1-like isoform X2 n=1 Tax=Centroberyx affinis TaxID=166261 RepID=UPI003A5B9419